jgi:hypothetical protein
MADAPKYQKQASTRKCVPSADIIGLAVFAVCLYIAMHTREPSVAGAMKNRAVQIFTYPAMLAALSVASAAQFRSQRGTAVKVADFVPAMALIAFASWSLGGA